MPRCEDCVVGASLAWVMWFLSSGYISSFVFFRTEIDLIIRHT